MVPILDCPEARMGRGGWLPAFQIIRDGFVFFVHTKFLLIDPLSDDPLVCSGSANFSSNSLLQNDENMLLVRGDTRVAGIYMTEFDRIFRHFYFRDIANELHDKGDAAKGAFLDETDARTESAEAPIVPLLRNLLHRTRSTRSARAVRQGNIGSNRERVAIRRAPNRNRRRLHRSSSWRSSVRSPSQ